MEAKRFGEKLQALRQEREMTLQQLAKLLSYKSHGYLSELEAGKKTPTVDLVIQIAKHFGVTTDELLMDDKELTFHASKKTRR